MSQTSGFLLLDQLLGLLDGGGVPLRVEPRVDERLEEFQRHLLRQTALMQLELGPDDDDRTAGIIDAFAEQVLPETTLLALEHIGKRFQRTLVGTGNRSAAPAVVEQGIDGFLQHPLLVADDDVRRAQFHQPFEAVVAVDDAAVEVVQVRRREAAAVERHERAQIRRDDRDRLHDHPLRPVAGIEERFRRLQPLGDLLVFQLGGRRRDLLAQLVRQLLEIDAGQHLADGLSADHRREGVLAELVLRDDVFFLGQKLVLREVRQTRLGNDERLEVEDALELLQRQIEQ